MQSQSDNQQERQSSGLRIRFFGILLTLLALTALALIGCPPPQTNICFSDYGGKKPGAVPGGQSCAQFCSGGFGTQCNNCCANTTTAGTKAAQDCVNSCPRAALIFPQHLGGEVRVPVVYRPQRRLSGDVAILSPAEARWREGFRQVATTDQIWNLVTSFQTSSGQHLQFAPSQTNEFYAYFNSLSSAQRDQRLAQFQSVQGNQQCLDMAVPALQYQLNNFNQVMNQWTSVGHQNPNNQADRFYIFGFWLENSMGCP